jgi:ubiquitin-like modifier-activating enzyme ATG7
MEDAAEALKFQQFSSFVDFSFWHELTKKKLDEYRLSEEPVDLVGCFSTKGAAGQPAYLRVDAESFKSLAQVPGANCVGSLVNTNTVESFVALDRKALVARAAERLRADLASGAAEASPALLTRFVLICFADLKAYKFFYWFCFPTVVSYRAMRVGPVRPLAETYSEQQLRDLREQFGPTRVVGLVVMRPDGRIAIGELRAPEKGAAIVVALADPGTLEESPGWSARGLLQLLHGRCGVERVRLLLLRDQVSDAGLRRGRVLEVRLEAEPAGEAVGGGWEKDAK